MPNVKSDRSIGGILGILDVGIPDSGLHVDRRNRGNTNFHGHDVRIYCEDRRVISEHGNRTQDDDKFVIGIKIFMSRIKSFGNVGLYLPFDMHIDSMYMKTFPVKIVIFEGGEPHETFYGTFKLLRADIAAKNLALLENKRRTSTTNAKDNSYSARFLSSLQNIYFSQGNEDRVPESEKQSKFEQINVPVVLQLISDFLTNLREGGYFPPSQSAGHTHFGLPNTRPLSLDGGVNATKTLTMRLLSFVYDSTSDIHPKIALAGFYLIGNNKVLTCTQCDCSPRFEEFQRMEQSSDFDRMHNIGCSHRKASPTDCFMYSSHSDHRRNQLDMRSVLDSGFLESFLRMPAGDSVGMPDEAEVEQPLTRSTLSHRYRLNSQETNSDRESQSQQRNNVVTLMGDLPFGSESVCSTVTFDADTFMHDLRWTYVQLPETPHKPVWTAFALPHKRRATFQGFNITLHLREELVENGFFRSRNDQIRTFCCDFPYNLDVDEHPSIVHANNRSSCPHAST